MRDAGTLRRFKVAFNGPQETKGAGGVLDKLIEKNDAVLADARCHT
jgi:hypothetical protein